MPNLQQNQEWLNHNAVRNYPLTMDATGVDQTGSFTLPVDFLVSLYLAVPTGSTINPGKFYLRKLDVSGVGFAMVIGYDDPGGAVDAASVSVARAAYARFQVYTLSGVGVFSDITGHLVLGSLDNLDLQPVGRFTFTPAAGRLEPDCIRPMLRGISGIRVQNGADVSELYTGDITLVAGPNSRLTLAGNSVTVSAIAGENLNEPCVCDDETVLGEPILTINNQGPSADGNFPLQGNECLQVVVEDGGIRLIDTCSKPCCGCAELEVITREQERLRSMIAAIDRLATTLESRTQQMDQVVLGSRLSDQSCLDCGDQIGTTTPVGTTSGGAPMAMSDLGELSREVTAAYGDVITDCPDCVVVEIPAMTAGGQLFAATRARLTKIGAVRSGIAVGYAAVGLSGDTRTLQFLATNNDVATYTAKGEGTCLERIYQLTSSVSDSGREWPPTFQLAGCA